MKGPIQSVEVSYLLHATEDPEKVRAAVAGLLSTVAQPETEEMEGHFGNRITRISYHLTGSEAGTAVANLTGRIPAGMKAGVLARLGEMIDEHSALFLRLDKQKLVLGALEEGSIDPIKIKLKPRAFLLRGSAKEFYARLLLGED